MQGELGKRLDARVQQLAAKGFAGAVLVVKQGEVGPYWHLRGNGGLLSTVGDLYRWHVALTREKVLSIEVKKKYAAPRARGVAQHVAPRPRLGCRLGRPRGHRPGARQEVGGRFT